MKCLICEQPVKTGDNRYYENALHGGTVWRAKGNYGSTLFDPDPMGISNGANYLEAVICDPCLKKKKGLVEEVTVKNTQTVERKEPDF